MTNKVLNMEEKKKFEKIIFGDIDRAKQNLIVERNRQENALKRELCNNPKAKSLLEKYIANQKQEKEIIKELKTLGLRINTYASEPTLDTEYGETKELKDFNEKTRRMENKMEELKRTYTLKLFAGGREIEDLFETLQKELQAIMK